MIAPRLSGTESLLTRLVSINWLDLRSQALCPVLRSRIDGKVGMIAQASRDRAPNVLCFLLTSAIKQAKIFIMYYLER